MTLKDLVPARFGPGAAESPMFADDHDVPPLPRRPLKTEIENLERKRVGLTAEAVPIACAMHSVGVPGGGLAS